jgi:leader peptidase (prepilin peptidase) / N-methyltransferase
MIPFAVLGGLVGLAAGEASRALADGGRPRGRPDRLSWLLAVGGALALVVQPAWRDGVLPGVAWAAVVALLLLVLACDVRERAVYPVIVYPGIALVAATAPMLGGSVVDALLGAVASSVVFGGLYLLARLRYGTGALGAGDVSAAALLGVVVGLADLPLALSLAGMIGGVMALVVALRARSIRVTFAYAPALCLAALTTTLLGGR